MSPRPSPESAVHLWELEQVAVMSLLGVCVPVARLRSLLRRNAMECCECCLRNQGALLRKSVSACSADNLFSREIDGLLVQQFAVMIRDMNDTPLADIRARMGRPGYIEKHLAGMLCGLLYSAERGKRELGIHLAYSCASCGLWNVAGSVNAQAAIEAAPVIATNIQSSARN